MNKKLKITLIIFLIIVLIILSILLINTNNKETYQKYTCTKTESVVNGNLDTTYIIKYEENDIKKVEYTLRYYGKTDKEKENINTLSSIVKEEARLYQENKGFSYKINRQTPNEFKITYYFDISKTKDDFLKMFNITKDLKEQKEYFSDNKEYECK